MAHRSRPAQPPSTTAKPAPNTHPGRTPRSSAAQQQMGAPSFKQAWGNRGAKDKLMALVEWGKATRVARTLTRYSVRGGGLLCNGMALTTLLSLTAALTVGWTIFMASLGSNTELKASVMSAISEAMPGLIQTGGGSGLIDLDSLVMDSAITPTSVIAFLVMIWSAMGVMGALGTSIRAMFGMVTVPENPVKKLSRNLLGLIGIGVSMLLTAGLGVIVSGFSEAIFSALHIDGRFAQVMLQSAATLIPMIVDALVLLLLLRVVAAARVPKRDVVWGMVIYAVASAILRMLGTTAVSAPESPMLATAATIVTLILWIALQVRVILTVCAWMANPPMSVPIKDKSDVHFDQTPNFVTQSVPLTLDWRHNLLSGELQVDQNDEDVFARATPAPQPTLAKGAKSSQASRAEALRRQARSGTGHKGGGVGDGAGRTSKTASSTKPKKPGLLTRLLGRFKR